MTSTIRKRLARLEEGRPAQPREVTTLIQAPDEPEEAFRARADEAEAAFDVVWKLIPVRPASA